MRAAIAVVVLAFAASAAAHPLMTKSQARAIVRDVNLKAADMPGYDSAPAGPPSASEGRTDARLARCYGGVAPSKALATGSSPVFIRGAQTEFDIFGSIVTVFPKASLVSKDLRGLRSARARECFRSAVQQAAQEGRGEPATVTVTVLQTAVSGVFGYRFTTQVGSGAPVYSDFFFMGVRGGEARVIVNATPTAPSQSLDDRVIRIVKTRLKARLDPNTVL